MENVLKCILKEKIIAIIRGVNKESILDTAKAIKKGGISCLEITVDHSTAATVEDTYILIELLKKKMGNDLCLGAGTVLTTEEVERCAKAGATYIISPNVNCKVIRKTKELGLISIPGALTPSEAVLAYETGADIVKLFPAGVLGIPYIKALRSPLNHIPMSAVGNVTPKNCIEFLDAGCGSVGVGGNLADLGAIEEGDFERITCIAREYARNIKAFSDK